MFALGVIVGRGTSPVTFDTESFQERLRVIVGEIPQEPPDEEKVDLDFFKTLNKPVAREPEVMSETPERDFPSEESPETGVRESEGPIPVKVSRKLATRNRIAAAAAVSSDRAAAQGRAEPKGKVKKERVKKRVEPVRGSGAGKVAAAEAAPPSVGGRYTIQVAAYRAFKDAVTQMSLLKEKGFTSYRIKGQAGGTTWYRVRTGSFKDIQSARTELDRLKQAKINGMIIKKDDQ